MFTYPRTIFYEILSESIEKSSLSLCDKKQQLVIFVFFLVNKIN